LNSLNFDKPFILRIVLSPIGLIRVDTFTNIHNIIPTQTSFDVHIINNVCIDCASANQSNDIGIHDKCTLQYYVTLYDVKQN